MSAPTPPTPEAAQVNSQLLERRIVVLNGEVNDDSAGLVASQMLLLAAKDPSAPITFYINSPGGSVSAGFMIYDTMQHIPNDVSTVAMGLAASMGQFLLTAGTPGLRQVMPNARVMMHQPLGGIGGTASDIRIQAEQMAALKVRLAQLIADHSGQSLAQVQQDSDRDRWFTAEEAVRYGLADQVVGVVARVAA